MISDTGFPSQPVTPSICMDGEGNAPPEDVGGSYGYTEFLNILANPSHPDHQHMLHWGRMQGYEDFNIEQVNRLLKRR
ncbi:MAG: IS1096 element passenger TnpR family protein [Bacillota bacterium]